MKLFKSSILIMTACITYALNCPIALASNASENTAHGLPGCQGIETALVTSDIVRSDAGHILINALFNGSEQQAIVDTGGIGVGGVLSESVLNKIAPQKTALSSVDVQGANHTRSMKIFNLNSTAIENATINDLKYVVSPGSILPDNNVEALIGSQYLCNFLIDIDLKNNTLSLHPKKTELQKILSNNKTTTWSTTEFVNVGNSGAIKLELNLNDQKVSALLDTGARHSIINWKAAKLIGLTKESSEITIEDTAASGIHGNAAKTAYTTNIASLSLVEGRNSSNKMKLHINDMPAFRPIFGDDAAVNLGMDFFNNRRLIIDYSNNQIAVSI